MSLVGPRPQVRGRGRSSTTGRMHRRLSVRPGHDRPVAGLGPQRPLVEEAVRLDLYYVDNWSMLQDLAILARTFSAVVASRGAY